MLLAAAMLQHRNSEVSWQSLHLMFTTLLVSRLGPHSVRGSAPFLLPLKTL